jgi:hypothetical protein
MTAKQALKKVDSMSGTEINWEGANAHVRERGCHISLLDDGWAISFMGGRKLWRRGFQDIGAARRSITCARKRLAKMGGQ